MPLSLEERLADSQTECESLRSQLSRLKEEIQIHKAENLVLKEADVELRRSHKASEEKYALLTLRLSAFNEMRIESEALTKANARLTETVSEYRQKTKALLSENSSLRKRVDALESQSVADRASKLQLLRQHRQATNTEATIKMLREENQSLQFQLRSVSVDVAALERDRQPQPTMLRSKSSKPALRLNVSCGTGTVTPGAALGSAGAAKDYHTPSTAHSPLYVRAQTTPNLSPCYSSNAEGAEWCSDDTVTPQRIRPTQTQGQLSPTVYEFAAQGLKVAAKRERETMQTKMEMLRLKKENKLLKERLDRSWEFCFNPSWFS